MKAYQCSCVSVAPNFFMVTQVSVLTKDFSVPHNLKLHISLACFDLVPPYVHMSL